MDLSGLIFVALAVAWAAYLVPKALRHHDDVVRDRSVEGFSDRMRVLARREPVTARKARLVVTLDRPVAATSGAPSSPIDLDAVRRQAGARATRRRRRVLSFLLLALVAVVTACALGRLSWPYAAIPAGALVAWLVACRLMVRRERAWAPVRLTPPADLEPELVEGEESAPTGAIAAVTPDETAAAEGLWDPVPVTLPTYVSKPAARRSVRTIDLDSTGVWTSGRTESDSVLAREAEAADRVRRRTSAQAAGEVPTERPADDEAVGS